jgi:hypothetical protein
MGKRLFCHSRRGAAERWKMRDVRSSWSSLQAKVRLKASGKRTRIAQAAIRMIALPVYCFAVELGKPSQGDAVSIAIFGL